MEVKNDDKVSNEAPIHIKQEIVDDEIPESSSQPKQKEGENEGNISWSLF